MADKCTSINSEILKWSRESAGYSLEYLCTVYSKYKDWENGIDFPTYAQLEVLANKYKRPIAIFFFPDIPKEVSSKKSFRTIPEYEFNNISPAIRFLFRKGLSMQENLKELNNNKNTEYTAFSEKINNINQFDADTINKIRLLLGISVDIQQKVNDRNKMFELWRNAFADIGIYVFKEAFKDNNISGFCLYDKMYPIIFVNNSTAKNRQIFTLFHELAHIILKGGHIDLVNRDYVEDLPNREKEIEIICNKFAGNFLVPNSVFADFIKNKKISEILIEQLADRFSVSQEVIARKLLDNKLISRTMYLNTASKMSDELSKQASSDGGNYYYNQITYLGKRYLGLIFDKYNAKIINFDQAVKYTGINAAKFNILENKYTRLLYGGAF